MTFKHGLLIVDIGALCLGPANAQSAKDAIEVSNAEFMKSMNSSPTCGLTRTFPQVRYIPFPS